MAFPFEHMVVYQKAEQWADLAEKWVGRSKKKVSHEMLDQLARAANSIPLNVAEGLGRWNGRDRLRFFQFARGSVYECVPIIRFLRRKELITDEEYKLAYGYLDECGKIITALMKRS